MRHLRILPKNTVFTVTNSPKVMVIRSNDMEALNLFRFRNELATGCLKALHFPIYRVSLSISNLYQHPLTYPERQTLRSHTGKLFINK